jgi:hypothetical protein
MAALIGGSLPAQDKLSQNGLWSLSLGADLAYLSSRDAQALGPDPTAADEKRSFVGLGLALKKHVSDSYFVGLGFSSLPRSYSFASAVGTERYDWDLLGLQVLGGFNWYRFSNSALYVQAEAGAAMLNQASYRLDAATPKEGAYDGSAFSSAVALGGSWNLMPSVALDLQGGYRRILFDSLSASPGVPSPGSLNYSGPFARLQAVFYWGLANPWGEGPEAPAPLPPR